jgi:hypothetical protein
MFSISRSLTALCLRTSQPVNQPGQPREGRAQHGSSTAASGPCWDGRATSCPSSDRPSSSSARETSDRPSYGRPSPVLSSATAATGATATAGATKARARRPARKRLTLGGWPDRDLGRPFEPLLLRLVVRQAERPVRAAHRIRVVPNLCPRREGGLRRSVGQAPRVRRQGRGVIPAAPRGDRYPRAAFGRAGPAVRATS